MEPCATAQRPPARLPARGRPAAVRLVRLLRAAAQRDRPDAVRGGRRPARRRAVPDLRARVVRPRADVERRDDAAGEPRGEQRQAPQPAAPAGRAHPVLLHRARRGGAAAARAPAGLGRRVRDLRSVARHHAGPRLVLHQRRSHPPAQLGADHPAVPRRADLRQGQSLAGVLPVLRRRGRDVAGEPGEDGPPEARRRGAGGDRAARRLAAGVCCAPRWASCTGAGRPMEARPGARPRRPSSTRRRWPPA